MSRGRNDGVGAPTEMAGGAGAPDSNLTRPRVTGRVDRCTLSRDDWNNCTAPSPTRCKPEDLNVYHNESWT